MEKVNTLDNIAINNLLRGKSFLADASAMKIRVNCVTFWCPDIKSYRTNEQTKNL